ncbi:MAG: hypothetical protein K8I30_08305 [Anaerolineae bacterium]|nr:hypothetical protein [Anaerolineae bacterium]
MMTDDNAQPARTRKRARLLMILTALLAVVQIGAVARALRVPDAVAARISLPLPLEAIASLLWALLSLGVLMLLWKRERRARLYAAWLAVGFSIYSLIRLLLFSQADYDRGRFPFLLVVIAVLLILPVAFIVRGRRTDIPR